jgi:hypothetical protein
MCFARCWSLLTLQSGRTLRVPTAEETLRIKAFLVVRRNQTRDAGTCGMP